MAVERWTILAIISAIIAFTIAARDEFSTSEMCEDFQKYIRLMVPLYYGFVLDFKNDDKNLQGRSRILPTRDLQITDCKSRRMLPDNSSTAITANLKDRHMMIMFQNRPWVELINPFVQMEMKSEDSETSRKFTFHTVKFGFSDALINKTSLDGLSTKAIENVLSVRTSEKVKSLSFNVQKKFRLRNNAAGKAILEMFKYYVCHLSNQNRSVM